ncbi:MAG: deoxyhypusine synthase family protein [Nitrososphaerota archaeon]|nr:deoxyhypusine synthase family protein [Aigarchaeota archaeon]MDW8076758.1 deoxyhypusine synthase family protein [Nitrososphaerota archaeon]
MIKVKLLKQFDADCSIGYCELLKRFSEIGMVARELGRAFSIMVNMFMDKECHRLLGIAGAAVASGLRPLITKLIRFGFVNTIVTTGANITHDIIEAIGGKHFVLEREEIDDVKLAKMGIYRIYNIGVTKESYIMLEKFVDETFGSISGTFSSSDIVKMLASRINDENSFVRASYELGVEVFSPALADSIIGSQIRFRTGGKVKLDTFSDIGKLVDRVWTSKRTGAIFLGGGTPKHFTMMAVNMADRPLSYAVQITTDREEHGGLSGARLEEAKSWGKVKVEGMIANVCLDMSIALPLLLLAFEEWMRQQRPENTLKS